MLYKIAQKSHVSQSNGSLMKITPMIFFLTLLTLYPQRYDRASEQEEMLKLAEGILFLTKIRLEWYIQIRYLLSVQCFG